MHYHVVASRIVTPVVNHHHIPKLLALHILPGLFALLVGAALLAAWEVANLMGFRYGSRWHHAVPVAGVVLGVVSCLLMAARFIYIA